MKTYYPCAQNCCFVFLSSLLGLTLLWAGGWTTWSPETELFQPQLLGDSVTVPPFFSDLCFTHRLYNSRRKCVKDLAILYLGFLKAKSTMHHSAAACWGYSLRLLKVTRIQITKNASSCGFLCSLNSPPNRKYVCLCMQSSTLKCYNVKKTCKENLSNLPRCEFRDLLHLTWMRRSDAELRCRVDKPRGTEPYDC